MKWGELISVQPFSSFFASESISQIQTWHELIHPEIHNENKELGFHGFRQRKLFAAHKSLLSLTQIGLFVQKLGILLGEPSCFRTSSGNQMCTLKLYHPKIVLAGEVRRGSNVSGSRRKRHVPYQLITICAPSFGERLKSETTNGKISLGSFSKGLCEGFHCGLLFYVTDKTMSHL